MADSVARPRYGNAMPSPSPLLSSSCLCRTTSPTPTHSFIHRQVSIQTSAIMPVTKTERRHSAASKTGKSAAGLKSTPTNTRQQQDEQKEDSRADEEDDSQPLRLFKHTPLPTTIDGDDNNNNSNNNNPANSTQPATQQTTTTTTDPEANKRHTAPSQPSIHLTPADYTKLKSLYQTITTIANHLTTTIHNHTHNTLPSSPPTAAGNSLLELKNRLLLQYVVRLVHVVRVRVGGGGLGGEASVDEMNEIRVVLERIRPIEKKIKYSIDKLLAAPVTPSTSASADPLQYRPNPLDLLSATTTPTPTATTATRKQPPRPQPAAAAALSPPTSPTASAVYQAPHHVPVLPSDAARGRREPRVSAARLRSLYGEVGGERPEERLVEGGGYGEMGEASDEEEEKREYEERMMVRLVETKADKKRKRERERRKGLDNMDEYDELRQFVERRERDERGDAPGEGRGGGGERRAGGRAGGDEMSRVDDLFDGVERGEGPSRKRARGGSSSSKRGKTGRGGKGRGGKRR